MELVAAGDDVSDLPADPAVNFDEQRQGSGVAVLIQRRTDERRDGDGGAGDEGGPDIDVLVALVESGDDGAESDLLVPVDGVDVELVVVDSDPAIGVAGGDGEEEIGGEEAGDGGVEGVDGDVLEEESGLRGPEDGPDDEDREEDEEDENPHGGADCFYELLPLLLAVLFAVVRHDGAGRPPKRGKLGITEGEVWKWFLREPTTG